MLKPEIFLTLFLLTLFFATLLLHLLIKLFFYLLFELFLTHFFKLFLFLEKFSVEFNQGGPFIIIVSFDLVDWFRNHGAGFGTSRRAFWWAWYLTPRILVLYSLGRCLALSLCFVVSFSNFLFRSLRFSPLRLCFFWIKNKKYSSG